MKSAIILVCLFVLAVAWGAQSVFLGLRDRDIVEISCADYVLHPPSSRHIRLVDCEPDFSHTLVRTENGNLDATFVPVRPRGDTGPAQLVVETDDERLSPALRTYEGMMRLGFLDEPSDGFLQTLSRETGTSPGAVILALGSEPHLGFGLVALFGGLAGLGFAGWRLRQALRR